MSDPTHPTPSPQTPAEIGGSDQPTWLPGLTGRLDDFGGRLTALEEAVGRIVELHAGDLRQGIVADISVAVSKWINPILEDNATTKRALKDLESRMSIVEGKLEELRKSHE